MINQEKFQRWVDDLEDRLAAYLFQNEPKLDWPETGHRRVIEVSEREQGVWEVFVNGAKRFYFDGPDAQNQANRAAAELANRQ